MREVHDFWHVLFDCHTNVFGELAIKGVEFVQASILGFYTRRPVRYTTIDIKGTE